MKFTPPPQRSQANHLCLSGSAFPATARSSVSKNPLKLRRIVSAICLSSLAICTNASTVQIEDLSSFFDQNKKYGLVEIIDNTEYILNGGTHSVDYLDNVKFSLYTKYGPKDIIFTGAADGSTTISASSAKAEASLLEIRQTQGNLTISDLTFDGNGKTGNAILFGDCSNSVYNLEGKLKNITIRNFDNSQRTNSGNYALIQGDPALYSGRTVRYWFKDLSFENVLFENNRDKINANTGLFDLYAQNTNITDLTLKNNNYEGSALGLLTTASGSLSGISAEENSSKGASLNLSFNKDDYIDKNDENFGRIIIDKSSFNKNTSTSNSIFFIGGFNNTALSNSSFVDNTADNHVVEISQSKETSISNVFLNKNKADGAGISLFTPNSASGQSQSVVIDNLQASENIFSSVIQVSGEIESTKFQTDILLRNNEAINWSNPEADYAFDFEISNGSTVSLNVNAQASFSTDKGILVNKARYANGTGKVSISKTGLDRWTLGGSSKFAVDTIFDVQEGTLTLTPEARLNWNETTATDQNAFLVHKGASLEVMLHDVSMLEASAHGSLAPISLAGHGISFAEGSSLHISVADFETVSEGKTGWLILAENARLDAASMPDITFTDEENWLFRLTGEDLGLQQGIPQQSGTVTEGTENNVYIGYELEDQLHPDEGATTSLVTATSHFALSSIQRIADGLLFYRPDKSDSLWARPAYLHDRRTADDTVGFDAQLRGITVGKDFRTEKGFWGIALGHGNGKIHSLGAQNYTSGDLQSTWFALYGEHQTNYLFASGTLAYLYQKADQHQQNNVGELHTQTKNDIIWADVKIGHDFLLDADAESTTTLLPTIGLEYAWLRQRNFNVNLGELGLLTGEKESMHYVGLPLDFTLSHDRAGSGSTRHHFDWRIGGTLSLSDRDMSGDFTDFRGQKADEWTLVPLDRWQAETQFAYTLYDRANAMTLTLGCGYVYGENREQTEAHAVIRWLW